MHFAAYSLVGESVENPFKYLGDNVSNAIHLIDSADASRGRAIYPFLNGKFVR